MRKDCIEQTKSSYLLNMNNQENKINENNIIIEYGEQDLKQILLQVIKQEYINHYKDRNITSLQKESNIKPMENIWISI